MALGGQEIANAERFAAYTAALGLPTLHDAARCPSLAAVLADDPYTDPATGPWVDAAVPASAGFAGLYISAVTGLDASTSVRAVTATAAGSGGVPTLAVNAPRTMAVTGFLAGDSPAALEHGLAWLDAVLHDDCDPCAGATLCMLADCPDCPHGTDAQASACWEEQARTLHDVVCVDGPRITQVVELSGCGGRGRGATVEFTLVAAAPFIHRTPVALADALTFAPPPPDAGCAVQWWPVGPGRQVCPPAPSCGPPTGCLVDPALPPLPVIPRAPRPAVACVNRTRAAWAAATATPGLLPRWLDSVPVITVRPGPAPLRRLSVLVYDNPMLVDVTDPDQLDRCSVLAELNVTYLPRDVELVVDGREQRAYVTCPGGGRDNADGVVFGADGGPWPWPRLVCGAAVSVVALVDDEFYDPAATVSVALAARQDVA
jgi:hypothetical protein